jgi:hypothetical protein
VGVSGEGGPRRPGRARPSEEHPPANPRRARERSSRAGLLPVLAVLLLALLVVVAIFLWRTLGDEVPGASVARDTIDSGREPRVSITNGPGSVRVNGTNGQAVEYEVTRYALAGDPAAARNSAAEVPVDVTREEGSTITLETAGGGETGADYVVGVPAAGRVEIEAEEGDVAVDGLDGNVSVLARSGDVEVRDVAGDVTVEAEQGDVTVSGMRTDTGNLEILVGSGDVSLEDLIVGTLEATVEAGDVTFSGRFSGEGRVSVGTGDITANLPSGDATNLDLQTLVGSVSREPSDGGQDGAGREGQNNN